MNSNSTNSDFDIKLKTDGSVDVDYYLQRAHAMRSECITNMIRSLFRKKADKVSAKTDLPMGSFARERIQLLGFQKMTLEF